MARQRARARAVRAERADPRAPTDRRRRPRRADGAAAFLDAVRRRAPHAPTRSSAATARGSTRRRRTTTRPRGGSASIPARSETGWIRRGWRPSATAMARRNATGRPIRSRPVAGGPRRGDVGSVALPDDHFSIGALGRVQEVHVTSFDSCFREWTRAACAEWGYPEPEDQILRRGIRATLAGPPNAPSRRTPRRPHHSPGADVHAARTGPGQRPVRLVHSLRASPAAESQLGVRRPGGRVRATLPSCAGMRV